MFRFRSFLFTISFFSALPVLLGTDGSRFTECSRPFKCGEFAEVYYPFWGNGRPEYCGHPNFELKCRDDSVEIEIQQQSYRVWNISHQEQTLHVATVAAWQDDCPSSAANLSLLCNLFNCTLPLNQNITLAYGCPFVPDPMSFHQLRCSLHGVLGENYFWVDYNMGSPPDLSRCNRTITVPILQSHVQSLILMESSIVNVSKDGFVVGYGDTFCNGCERSGGQCGYQWNTGQTTCFCDNGSSLGTCPPRPIVRGSTVAKKVGIGAFSATGVVILGVILLLVNCAIKKSRKLVFSGKTMTTRNFEEFIKHQVSLAPKRHNFKEIKKMTQSFKNKLGHGGYGSVFKGVLHDGRLVVVKVLDGIKGNGEEFINEVASISRTSHVNIVSLLGYCFDGSKRALVYEFMPNGSLEKYIFDKGSSVEHSTLGWETLQDISVGIARGLEYLHRGCSTRILHFDIKPHNILLDQDFYPKISDFGLAKLCPRKDTNISMLDARGTAGYIAPEVFCRNFGGISHKSDVYSYGMMILEMVGGRKNIVIAVDHTSEIYFPHWIHKRIELNEDLRLHGIVSETQEDIPRKMILVGLWCIQINPFDRPSMSRVLEMLEGSLEDLEIPPKPYLSSPSRLQGDSSTN